MTDTQDTVSAPDSEGEGVAGAYMHAAASDPVWRSHEAYEAGREARYHAEGRVLVNRTRCEGTLRLLDDTGGATRDVQCDACGEQVAVSRMTLDPDLIGRERLARSRLPLSVLERVDQHTPEAEGARAALRRFARAWKLDTRPQPPLLWGEPGAGKTHLLTHCAAMIARVHLDHVVYWPTTELLDAVRGSYNGREGSAEWEHALEVPLLVLDDIGAERLTDWTRERLSVLIDHRYRLGLPVLAATNVPPGQWIDTFGARAASRLAGMTDQIELRGPDWRQASPSELPATNTSDDDTGH